MPAPTLVGVGTTYLNVTDTTVNASLPGGCAVGDLAICHIQTAGQEVTAAAGIEKLGQYLRGTPHSIANLGITILARRLTADDISAPWWSWTSFVGRHCVVTVSVWRGCAGATVASAVESIATGYHAFDAGSPGVRQFLGATTESDDCRVLFCTSILGWPWDDSAVMSVSADPALTGVTSGAIRFGRQAHPDFGGSDSSGSGVGGSISTTHAVAASPATFDGPTFSAGNSWDWGDPALTHDIALATIVLRSVAPPAPPAPAIAYGGAGSLSTAAAGATSTTVAWPSYTGTTGKYRIEVLALSWRGAIMPTVDLDYWALVARQSGGNTTNNSSSNSVGNGALYVHIDAADADAPSAAQRTVDKITGSSRALYRIAVYETADEMAVDVAVSETMASGGGAPSVWGLTPAEADELIIGLMIGARNVTLSSFVAAAGATTASGATDTSSPPAEDAWIERFDSEDSTSPTRALALVDAIKTTAASTGAMTATVSGGDARHSIIAAAFRRKPAPLAGFPNVESSTLSTTNANTMSHPVALPATVNSGDVLVVAAAWDGSPTITWDNATAGTWTEKVNRANGTSCRVVVYSKIADGTEGGKTLSLTSSASEQMVARVFRISGAHGDVEAADTATSNIPPNPPSLTPSWGEADTLWLAIVAIDTLAHAEGAPSNYGPLTSDSSSASGLATLATAYRQLTAATEDPGVFTGMGNVPWAAATIAIRPAGAPPAASPRTWSYLIAA